MKYILGNAVQYARTGTLMIDNPPGHREDIWTGKRDGKGHKLMERYQLWTDRPLALLDMLASTAYDAILAAHKGMARGRIHGADWKGTGQDLSRMGQWAGNLQSPVARTAMDLRDAALGHGNRQQLMRDIPGANVPGSLPVVGPMIQNQVNRLEGRPRMPTDPTQQWLGVQQFPVSTRPDSTLNKRLLPQPRQWAHNLVGQ